MYAVDRNAHGEIMSLAYRGFFDPEGIVPEDENGEVSLCHATANSSYQLITVPKSAVESHMDGHKDMGNEVDQDDHFPIDGNC